MTGLICRSAGLYRSTTSGYVTPQASLGICVGAASIAYKSSYSAPLQLRMPSMADPTLVRPGREAAVTRACEGAWAGVQWGTGAS